MKIDGRSPPQPSYVAQEERWELVCGLCESQSDRRKLGEKRRPNQPRLLFLAESAFDPAGGAHRSPDALRSQVVQVERSNAGRRGVGPKEWTVTRGELAPDEGCAFS